MRILDLFLITRTIFDQAAEFSLIMNEAMSEVRLKSNRVIIRDENDIFGNLKLKISIRSIKITLIN